VLVRSPTFSSVEHFGDDVVLRGEYERLRELHALAQRLRLAADAEALWWQIADEVAYSLGSDRVVVVAAAAVAVMRRVATIEAVAVRRMLWRHAVAPGVLEKILAGQVEARVDGARREVTMLFVDIRSSLHEALPMPEHAPGEMVTRLKAYFETVVEVLFRHGGTLDKYVGDELIAVFGAPIAQADAPVRAVRCALEMVRVVEAHSRECVSRGRPAIHVGIGVHTGPVLAGALGAGHTRRYTVLGAELIVGARLCRMTQPGEILISESTYARVERDVLVVLHPPEGGPGGKLGPSYRVQRLRKSYG